MSRVESAFKNRKAFIPFITAGDPDLDITEQLVYRLVKEGADLIELGIPFSDPVAEGPIIQAADERALKAGTTTDKIFTMVEKIRQTCDIPLAFMTYMNPIFVYGTERFVSECKRVGVDALIVPDVPFEERDELQPYCDRYGIDLVFLIAPTSKDRIREIATKARGFLYCVSSLGVTGTRGTIGDEAAEMIRRVKEIRDIPCAIGFGIASPEQAKVMAGVSDGVIVGSAIVSLVGEYGRECVEPVAEFVGKLRKAIE